MESIIKWLARSKRQVVLTTHSIDVLHILTQIGITECKIIVLKKKPDDVIEYKVLSIDDLEEFFESGLDIRKMIEELKL